MRKFWRYQGFWLALALVGAVGCQTTSKEAPATYSLSSEAREAMLAAEKKAAMQQDYFPVSYQRSSRSLPRTC